MPMPSTSDRAQGRAAGSARSPAARRAWILKRASALAALEGTRRGVPRGTPSVQCCVPISRRYARRAGRPRRMNTTPKDRRDSENAAAAPPRPRPRRGARGRRVDRRGPRSSRSRRRDERHRALATRRQGATWRAGGASLPMRLLRMDAASGGTAGRRAEQPARAVTVPAAYRLCLPARLRRKL